MSRVGRKTISLPEGVSVDLDGRTVKVKGPKGELSYRLLPGLEVGIENGVVSVAQTSTGKTASAMWGLTRALINNMVVGVSRGYQKVLELHGTGYRAELKGNTLMLHLGYSHAIEFPLPKGITTNIEGSKIAFDSIDKQLVGQVAADVRAFRPPEPYKGRGIRFVGEHVRSKAGKSAAS